LFLSYLAKKGATN